MRSASLSIPSINSLLSFLFVFCFLPFQAIGLAHAVPTNKDYGNLPTISLVSISPSGNLFAYRKVENDQDFLMVYSRSEKKIISGAPIVKFNPLNTYFVNENKIIIIVSHAMEIPGYKGMHDVKMAFVFDIKSQRFEQLLRLGDRIGLGQTDIGSVIAISPDRKIIFMPAYIGDYLDETQDYSLIKVNIESPKKPNIFYRGNNKVYDYFMDDKENLLVREAYSDSSNKHTLSVKDGDKWREIYSDKSDIMDLDFVGLMPDRKSMVVLDENKETGRVNYYSMSLADGSLAESNFGRADADITGVITDINRVVLGVRYSGFNPSYRFFDPVVNTRVADILKQFPEQSVSLEDWTPDWKSILVYVEGSDNSGTYYLFTDGEPAVQLATSRPNIPREHVNPVATVKINARDGFVVPTLLTIPHDRLETMKNLPAVLLPHGGPEAYDEIGFDWMAQAFANKGYLVIQPQFRGSAGFGLEHRRAGYGEWGKKMQDDLTDSLQFLINKGYVDASKVCIVGASYGGYAALAGGAFTPDLYKCVVSINGVSDLRRMLHDEKKDYGKDSWVVSYWEKSIAKGKAKNVFLESISPVNFADKYKTPVLLIHGENDETVPIRQSKIMYKALKKADKIVEFKELKNENHYLLSGETRLEMLESMAGFVEKHLGH